MTAAVVKRCTVYQNLKINSYKVLKMAERKDKGQEGLSPNFNHLFITSSLNSQAAPACMIHFYTFILD